MGENKHKRLSRRGHRASGRVESGQGLGELALVIPIVVVILIGMVDAGRALMIQHVLNDAARDAARVAALGGMSASEVKAKVKSQLEDAGLDSSKADIDVSGVNADTAEPTIVSIDYPTELMVLKLLGLGGQLTLSSTSRMLHE